MFASLNYSKVKKAERIRLIPRKLTGNLEHSNVSAQSWIFRRFTNTIYEFETFSNQPGGTLTSFSIFFDFSLYNLLL